MMPAMRASDLRLPPGRVDLSTHDPRSTPGFDDDKAAGKQALLDLGDELSQLQEQLFAEGREVRPRSVLLVLQGMDTSGKGGVLRHTVGLVDPQGVRITSFKSPTEEERAHDFLWRVRRALPAPGYLGVFDRSHYEDVLIQRVRSFAPPEEIERRYEAINDFEKELVDSGTTVLKCMLHISPDEQRERLLARLDDPTKHWKYNPGDLDERALWSAYRDAYEIALERTNTEHAPWHVVPSDRKWFRNLAVGRLLRDTLAALDPQWPAADFDVEAERRRLLDETPLA
jgi:PPK2 family polyphosphate:nucleotide phosphotransferase